MQGRPAAFVMALGAAFLWSTYYLFVLAVSPGTRPSAILWYPFVSGAAAYTLWSLGRRHGRLLAHAFTEAGAYLRVGLLVGMQLSVLAATLLTGPVDAALLSLLGDVVATPLVVAALFVGHRRAFGSPWLVTGLLLCLAGGALAIVGGHGISAVHGLGWTVVVTVPLSVAFYFVLSARAGATTPVSVVVAQTMIGAALVTAAVSPLVPGGPRALFAIGAVPLALLLTNGLLSFFVAPVLYFRAIERAGLVLPPLLMTGIPVFTLLLSAAVLAIAPAPLALLGVPVAVLGGVVALTSGAGSSPGT